MQFARAVERVAHRLGFVSQKSAEDAIRALISQFDREWGTEPDTDPEPQVNYYEQNVWVYASTFVIATGLAAIPLKLRRHLPGGTAEDVDDHPALKLLDRPNEQGMSRFDLIEAIVSWLEITGNAYLAVTPSAAGGWAQLWPLPADRVRVHPTLGGREGPSLAGAFTLTGTDGRRVRFDATEIIHFRYFAPSEKPYGMSWLQPAKHAARGHLFRQQWDESFWKHSARPDVFIETDAPYSKNTDERLLNWWNSKFRGPANAHRLGIGWGGLKAKILSLAPKDMDFKNLNGVQKQEMLAGAGVQPFKVSDLEHASWANSREQNSAFYRDTLQPKGRKVQGTLTRALHRDWENTDDLFFEFDFSGVEALQEDQNEKHERIREDYRAGLITRNEAREETGRDDVGAGGDVYFVPSGGFSEPALPAEPRARRSLPSVEVRALPAGRIDREADTLQRYFLWRQFVQGTEPIGARLARVYAEMITDQTEEAIDRLRSIGFTDAGLVAALAFLDSEREIEAAAANVSPIISEAGIAGAERAQTQIDGLVSRQIPEQLDAALHAEVDGFAALHSAALVTRTNAATKAVIRRLVQQGISDGLSETEQAEAIRRRLASAQFLGPRTLTIARTETTGAFNFGTLANYRLNDAVSQKEWLSSRDEEVRDPDADPPSRISHRIDGQRRDVSQPFELPVQGGPDVLLMYPGEFGVAPEANINCRCTVMPVIGGGFGP